MSLWPWRRREDPPPTTPELRDVKAKADRLTERADRVAESLEGRLHRNHWGETIAAIARRE